MIYNVSQPANSRVVSVQVQCAACHVPSYSKLEKSGVYKVLVNDFIAGGGDGFEKLENLNLTILSESNVLHDRMISVIPHDILLTSNHNRYL